MSIRILVVDDDSAVRSSISELLACETDIEVIAEAGDGRKATALARRLMPDIALLDVCMAGANGIQAAAEISRLPGIVRVIGMSMHDEPEWVKQMIKAGAHGYLLKETAAEELAPALREVFAGNTYFGLGVEVPGVIVGSFKISARAPSKTAPAMDGSGDFQSWNEDS